MGPWTVVLKARNHRAARLAGRGRGGRRNGAVPRVRGVWSCIRWLTGRCGWPLSAGAGTGGGAVARSRRPGVLGPGRAQRGTAYRVRGPETADWSACVRSPGRRADGARHAGDCRLAGRAGLAGPGGRTRPGRRAGPAGRTRRRARGSVPRRLAVRSASGRGARVRCRVWPQSRLQRGCRSRRSAGVMARSGTGRACQVRRACRVGKRRGPGGAARVEHGRWWRRGIVVAGRPPGGRCACPLSSHARTGLHAAGRLRVTRRGPWSHDRARLHRDRIPDRARLARSGRRDRRWLHRDRIPDRSWLPWAWRVIAAWGRLARIGGGCWRGSVGRVMITARLPRSGAAGRARRMVRASRTAAASAG